MYLIDGQLHDIYSLDQALQDLQPKLPQRLATSLDSSTVIKAITVFAQLLRDPRTNLLLDSEQRQA